MPASGCARDRIITGEIVCEVEFWDYLDKSGQGEPCLCDKLQRLATSHDGGQSGAADGDGNSTAIPHRHCDNCSFAVVDGDPAVDYYTPLHPVSLQPLNAKGLWLCNRCDSDLRAKLAKTVRAKTSD